MKLNVYAIFDTAIGAYLRPFFLKSDGQANRMFGDLVMDAETEVGKHPECYTLMRLGVWDDQNAEYSSEIPSKIISGLEAVSQSRKVDQSQLELLQEQVEELEGNGENHSRASQAVR